MQTEKRQEQAQRNNQVTQNKYDYFFVFMSSSDQGERRESAKAEECLNAPSKTRDLSEKQFLTKNTISITHLAFFLYWRSFFEFFFFFYGALLYWQGLAKSVVSVKEKIMLKRTNLLISKGTFVFPSNIFVMTHHHEILVFPFLLQMSRKVGFHKMVLFS